jgi:hypothetical protein
MGEAKRRRLAGWVPANVRLECFIAQSKSSDAHSVYLGIKRGHEVELRLYNSFASIVNAWEDLCRCKKALQAFKYYDNQDNDQISQNFIRFLHDTFGVHSCDDAMYTLSGDTGAALQWLSQGGKPFFDEPPPGVHVEILNPPVKKKYKVLLSKREEPMESQCGNPEDTHVFSVGESIDELFLVEGRIAPIYSSYLSTAYMADYLNSRNQDSLSEQEMLRLLYEANQLQGKI